MGLEAMWNQKYQLEQIFQSRGERYCLGEVEYPEFDHKMVVSNVEQEEQDEWNSLIPLDPVDIVVKNARDDDDDDARVPIDSRVFSVAMDIPRKRKKETEPISPLSSSAILRWRQAAKKVLCMEDPFGGYHLEKYETEKVLRMRYNALKNEWVKDEILVKMAPEAFGRGAMRECFRLKRVRPSHFNHTVSTNYVAKRYINPVDSSVYKEDVKLQMWTKLWGEEFNRTNPPKKVDFCQMSVIQFLDRPEKPFYHLEHFIEGKYIKYNSNSGFIQCENARFTPQAFSHFTFEKSGHRQIVVDIQGVGDLYTDPQIHTYDGTDFNEGNLGIKGMALFFQSHVCNPICESLRLTPFDIDRSEMSQPEIRKMMSAKTCVRPPSRGSIGSSGDSPTVSSFMENFMKQGTRRIRTYSSPPDLRMARARTLSAASYHRQESQDSSTPSPPAHAELSYKVPDVHDYERSLSSESEDACDVDIDSVIDSINESMGPEEDEIRRPYPNYGSGRTRCDSECSVLESDKLEFQRQIEMTAQPSNVDQEVVIRALLQQGGAQLDPSILGQIHLELCRYYENGRFSPEDDPLAYNKEAALFHLQMAAQCGNLEGLLTLAKMYQGVPHDLLEAVELPEDREKAMKYLRLAAEAGDRVCMIQLAKDLDEALKWKEAVKWYNKAIEMDFDEGIEFDGNGMQDPVYVLLARLAAIYAQGGNGLVEDTTKAYELYQQAAEAAMAATKGRLANKYYELAECL